MNENCVGGWKAIGETLTKSEKKPEKDTKEVKIGIYGLRCKTTGKWYVGQSWNIENRWKIYTNVLCVGQQKIYRALKKYGVRDFDFHILEITCPSQMMIDRRENHWICEYNSIQNGYNIRGAGSRGRHSEETKNLMREKGLSRKHTSESIAKMREEKQRNRKTGKDHPNYGRKHSPEALRKIKEARKKQIHSIESNIKRSETMKKLWNERTRDSVVMLEIGRKITEGKIKEWSNKKQRLTS